MGTIADTHGLHRLSDDRIVLRNLGGSLQIFGTPWAGEGKVASRASAELAALVFLHQSTHDRLCPVSGPDVLHQLLPVASILWFDSERMSQGLDFCQFLADKVPAYNLFFTRECQVVELLDSLGLAGQDCS
jgi:hypothetical protein